MKFQSYLVILLVACATGLSLASEEKSPQISSLKSLSIPKKLGILAASHLRPSLLRGLDIKWSDLFSPDDLPWIDYMFVDFRSLLTQSLKVPENIPLPECDDHHIIDINESGWVFNWTLSWTSEESQMIGQQDTTSINEVTPTTFKNSFHAPSFVWRSPKAAYQFYDNYYGEFVRAQNFYYGIKDLYLNTSANYEFVPDVGIQISNLTIGFDIGYLRYNVEDIIWGYQNGTTERFPGYKYDNTDTLLYEWKYNQAEYLIGLEFRINCVLSGSRNDPDRCEWDDNNWYVSQYYYKMNVLQLFETIGLGSMRTS
ncbi:unnamed protein product [Orchesella dallaii]|uniref:Uncharacterized protein n=1 Tax=Orchesella dallaii TaxID=48710 RepID=A0ABP1RUY0_9HEXA